MNTPIRSRLARALGAVCILVGGLALLAQCRSSSGEKADVGNPHAAWGLVYEVLQHPRCLNCHPAGDVPLQGDDSRPHAQLVQRGRDGRGRFAMRCTDCHPAQNSPDAHGPPGAPGWQLPHPEVPLVFEGLSPGDLCRQLKDPARNGGKKMAEILHYVAEDELVLWGWDPGVGRTPVPISHAAFVAAMKAWIDAGCGCPQ
ncbi:MAG: hypothetical protein ACKVXR_15895 [Planctomycetota bacterium]